MARRVQLKAALRVIQQLIVRHVVEDLHDDVELEHGTRDLETNVTNDDVTVTAKISRAHLNEFPDYYARLALMEAEAETYWAGQGE